MGKSTDGKKPQSDSMSFGRLAHILGRFLVGQKGLFTMAGLMLVFEAATAVLIPLLAAYIIDYLAVRLQQIDGKAVPPPLSPMGFLHLPPLVNPDFDTIALVTIGIIVLTMINSLGDSMAEIYLAKGGRSLGYNLRVALYAHLQKLSLAFHDQRRTGDILTRVTSDVAALEDFVISSLSDFVGSVLLIVFILIAMVLNAWQVALVAAVIIPVMALISNYFTSKIKAASKKRRTSEGELASAAQEMLTSIRVIQTYGLGSFEQSLFAQQSQKAMDAALEAAAYQARFSWVVSVLGAVSTAAIIWMAVWLIFRQPITAAGIGLLTAYIKYIQDMFKPTKRIIQEWNTFGKLITSVERIGDLLDIKPSVQDLPGAVAAPSFQGHIEFRDVTFSYPSLAAGQDGVKAKQRIALKNISFRVDPGQVVAVVGHTGAGKSTIVQLLPRLYDPDSGQVLIDEHDLREFTLESLRSQISMVLQESILFSGSLVENIAYGRPDATGAEIIEAARQANAHEFIEKMPEGYYTMLGERGSNLSGGQRQRIAIARAFIRNTPILIMDEPTTGLDAESTDLVLRALRKLMKGKTTIIISHDLNLIRDADQIIVINSGEIEQMGTHSELIEAGGLYANLYMMQMGQSGSAQPALPVAEKLAGLPSNGSNGGIENTIREGWPKMHDFDLPRSAPFITMLPGLATAFDEKAMKKHLEQALLGGESSGYEIADCIPGKAIYLPQHLVNMQYDLKLRETATGNVVPALVNARLFQKQSDGLDFFNTALLPLVQQMSGRPEVAPFAQPVAFIEPLFMTVSVFPIDGMLPTVIRATDPVGMVQIFNQTLPDALSGNFAINGFCLDLAHYGRFQRCVLRYRIDGELIDTREPHQMVVYGKVDGDGRGGLTVQVISALREKLNRPDIPYRFNVPLSYGYLPDLKLLLMESLPGEPVIKYLIKSAGSNGKAVGEYHLTLDESQKICALIAATLHGSGIRLGRRRTLEVDVAQLHDEIVSLQQIFPELGEQLIILLNQVVAAASQSEALPLAFSHGDFTYTQLIFDGPDAGLVDFDTICQAEPALDLGQFIAYQRLTIEKDQDPAAPLRPERIDGLCETFLSSYVEASRAWIPDEDRLMYRVSIYELISLIRLVLHSWQKLKGTRLQLAMRLLEERMACLTQIH